MKGSAAPEDWDESWWNRFTKAVQGLLDAQQFRHDLERTDLNRLFHGIVPKTGGQLLALLGLKAEVQQLQEAGKHQFSLGKPSAEKELSDGLKKAISVYETSKDDAGPYLIQEYTLFCVFDRWYKQQESVWRISFRFTDCYGGSVWLYGDPSFLHEGITGKLGQYIFGCAAAVAGECVSDLVDWMGSSRLILPTGIHKEPDLCLQPVGSTSKVPPFVVEVAYANESLLVLKEELVQWTLPGGAQVAFGVKVSLEKSDGPIEQRLHLRFLERRQGQKGFVKDIDFSPSLCSEKGHPNFVVEFPLATIFRGATDNQTLLEGVARIDLYMLQQSVLRLLTNDHVDFVWHPKAPPTAATTRSSLLGHKKTSTFKKKTSAKSALKKVRAWMKGPK